MAKELKPVNLAGHSPSYVLPETPIEPLLASDTGREAYLKSKGELSLAPPPLDRPKGLGPSKKYQSEVEHLLTGRYATVDYNADNEDIHGLAQSGWDKAANGTLKGLNLAATTFVGGLGTVYGVAKSIKAGKLSDIWKNEITEELDEYNKEVDNKYLPNYYSNQESNAAW